MAFLKDFRTWPTAISYLKFKSDLELLKYLQKHIAARVSDKYCLGWSFAVARSLITTVGLAIVVRSTKMEVHFFGLFVVAVSLCYGLSLNLVWIGGNTSSFFKRATVIGNSSGVAYGEMLSTAELAKYITGLCICLGAQIIARGEFCNTLDIL